MRNPLLAIVIAASLAASTAAHAQQNINISSGFGLTVGAAHTSGYGQEPDDKVLLGLNADLEWDSGYVVIGATYGDSGCGRLSFADIAAGFGIPWVKAGIGMITRNLKGCGDDPAGSLNPDYSIDGYTANVRLHPLITARVVATLDGYFAFSTSGEAATITDNGGVTYVPQEAGDAYGGRAALLFNMLDAAGRARAAWLLEYRYDAATARDNSSNKIESHAALLSYRWLF